MRAPCFGCGDRQIGCHGSCEKYAAYSHNNTQRRKEREVAMMCYEINLHGKEKTTMVKTGKKGYRNGQR